MKSAKQFRKKVLIWFWAISVVPFIMASVLLYRQFQSELLNQHQTYLVSYGRVIQSQLENFLLDKSMNATIVSQVPLFYQATAAYTKNQWHYEDPIWQAHIQNMDLLADAIVETYDLNSFFIVDAQGISIYDANPTRDIPLGMDILSVGRSMNNEAALLRALSGEQAWSRYLYSSFNESINMMVVTPIFDQGQDGMVVGALYFSSSHQRFSKLLEKGLEELEQKGDSFLVNQQGFLMSNPTINPHEGYSFLEVQSDSPLIQAFKVYEPEYGKVYFQDIYTNGNGQKVIGILMPLNMGKEQMGLVVELDYDRAMASIKHLEYMIIGFVLVFLLIVGMVAYYGGMSIIKPMEALVEWTKHLAKGDYGHKPPLSMGHDLKPLEEGIIQMAEAVADREGELTAQNETLEASYHQLEAYNQEIQRLNLELKHQADHDVLTQLPNRRYYVQKLKKALSNGQLGVVIMVDLNHFKEINDVYGHIYGDRILKQVGERLLSLQGETEDYLAARYGGDEFLILVTGMGDEQSAQEALSQIQNVLNLPYTLDTEVMTIEYYMGITFFPKDGTTAYELIANADMAMYHAKLQTHEILGFYHKGMLEVLTNKQNIRGCLQEALMEDLFYMVYQPQVALKDGVIKGFEALIRLKNQTIGPDVFIPIAEESGLIIQIGRWVIRKVLEQLSVWHEQGLAIEFISINLSAKQIGDDSLDQWIDTLRASLHIPEKQIEIELTEGLLLERNQKSLQFLNRLKGIGVSLALDDFGSGYASLNYLTYVHVNKVKLDRSFVNHFLDIGDTTIIKRLIELFHEMDMEVVAEGIETLEGCEVLKNYGCDYIQGYVYSRPVPPEQVPKLLDMFPDPEKKM